MLCVNMCFQLFWWSEKSNPTEKQSRIKQCALAHPWPWRQFLNNGDGSECRRTQPLPNTTGKKPSALTRGRSNNQRSWLISLLVMLIAVLSVLHNTLFCTILPPTFHSLFPIWKPSLFRDGRKDTAVVTPFVIMPGPVHPQQRARTLQRYGGWKPPRR